MAGADSGSIHAVNEAYRVLSDAGRRVVYDRSLFTSSAAPRAGAPAPRPVADRPPEIVAPARFPWRGLAIATVLAVVLVGGASLLTRPTEPPGPDGLLQPGSCVTIQPNTDAREAACTGDAEVDIVVRSLVPIGVACPFGTAPHRDHQGLGTACLVFP